MKVVTQPLIITRGITFPGILINCFDSLDFTNVFDITGWTPWAEVRSIPDSTLILDLLPYIDDPLLGRILIPAIQDEQTILLPEGKYKWDFILQDPGGQRLGPYIKGPFKIISKITQGSPPE